MAQRVSQPRSAPCSPSLSSAFSSFPFIPLFHSLPPAFFVAAHHPQLFSLLRSLFHVFSAPDAVDGCREEAGGSGCCGRCCGRCPYRVAVLERWQPKGTEGWLVFVWLRKVMQGPSNNTKSPLSLPLSVGLQSSATTAEDADVEEAQADFPAPPGKH